jgi:hypothetical protein
MRASRTIDGSMTGKKFLAYVERCLAPTLKRKDIVMIDNVPAHKAAGVREAIEARTTRHPGYRISPIKRKRIEEPFGWLSEVYVLDCPIYQPSTDDASRGAESTCRQIRAMAGSRPCRPTRQFGREARHGPFSRECSGRGVCPLGAAGRFRR